MDAAETALVNAQTMRTTMNFDPEKTADAKADAGIHSSGAARDRARDAAAGRVMATSATPATLKSRFDLEAAAVSDATARAADELAKEGRSENTVASYAGALQYWAAWYALRRETMLVDLQGDSDTEAEIWRAWGPASLTLPVAFPVVVTFITDHAERKSKSTPSGLTCELPPEVDAALVRSRAKGKPGPMKLSTLIHRVSVLSKAHKLSGAASNPCQDERVKALLDLTRRAYAKRSALATKQTALTADLLARLLETCDLTLAGRRDRALLTFAWATGGRRRSEVEGATLENLQATGQSFVYRLGHSKANQLGQDLPENYKPLVGSAAQAMRTWIGALRAAKITTGPIFRRVLAGDRMGAPLGAEGVRFIVKARCAAAGLEGRFSAHSLRSGFVTEAGLRDMPIGEAMAMTGHRTVATFQGYYQSAAIRRSKVASMLDTPPPKDA